MISADMAHGMPLFYKLYSSADEIVLNPILFHVISRTSELQVKKTRRPKMRTYVHSSSFVFSAINTKKTIGLRCTKVS
jgi:hypothetical protein